MQYLQLRESSARRSTSLRPVMGSPRRSVISTVVGGLTPTSSFNNNASKITNIPGHSRETMSDKADFVLVFQCIEIQRLSREVQLLRTTLADRESQAFIGSNYQVQIKQLSERCFNAEEETARLREELQKLNAIGQHLYNHQQQAQKELDHVVELYRQEKGRSEQIEKEADDWKRKATEAERNKEDQIERVNQSMEQNKKHIDRIVTDLSSQLRKKDMELDAQNRKTRDIVRSLEQDLIRKQRDLQQKSRENEDLRDWQRKCNTLEGELTYNARQLAGQIHNCQTLESQVNLLKKHNDALSHKLREQQELRQEKDLLKQQMEEAVEEARSAKFRHDKLEQELARNSQLEINIHQLRNDLQVAGEEVDRLQSALRQQKDANNRILQQLREQQMTIAKMREQQEQWSSQKAQLNLLKTLIQSVQSRLENKEHQLQRWKVRCQDAEQLANRAGVIQKDKALLEERFHDSLRKEEELRFALSKVEKQMTFLQKRQSLLKQERGKNQLLERQVQRMANQLQHQEGQLHKMKEQLWLDQEQMNRNRQKDRQINELEDRVRGLTNQINRLHKILDRKDKDIQVMERNQSELVRQVHLVRRDQEQLPQLQAALERQNRQRDQAQRQLGQQKRVRKEAERRASELGERVRSAEKEMGRAQQQREKMNHLNRSKVEELQQSKIKSNRLEKQLRRQAQIERTCQDLHQQVVRYVGELEATERKFREYEDAYKTERHKNQMLIDQLDNLRRDFEKQRTAISHEKNREQKEQNQRLQDALKNSRVQLDQREKQVDGLNRRIEDLQHKCSSLRNEFTRLCGRAQDQEKQLAALRNQVEQYQDYAARIHILDAQMDRLTAANKQLDAENKEMRLQFSKGVGKHGRERDLLIKVVLMGVEIQSLRRRVEARELREQDIRRDILAPIRNIP